MYDIDNQRLQAVKREMEEWESRDSPTVEDYNKALRAIRDAGRELLIEELKNEEKEDDQERDHHSRSIWR